MYTIAFILAAFFVPVAADDACYEASLVASRASIHNDECKSEASACPADCTTLFDSAISMCNGKKDQNNPEEDFDVSHLVYNLVGYLNGICKETPIDAVVAADMGCSTWLSLYGFTVMPEFGCMESDTSPTCNSVCTKIIDGLFSNCKSTDRSADEDRETAVEKLSYHPMLISASCSSYINPKIFSDGVNAPTGSATASTGSATASTGSDTGTQDASTGTMAILSVPIASFLLLALTM